MLAILAQRYSRRLWEFSSRFHGEFQPLKIGVAMRGYHALCSDCPKCTKEKIAFLAYSSHKKGVWTPMLKRMTCHHCFHEYQQSIQEMVLEAEDSGRD
jgi:hypothetical protein